MPMSSDPIGPDTEIWMVSPLTLDLTLVVAVVVHQAFVATYLAWTRRGRNGTWAGAALFLSLNAAADVTLVLESVAPSALWFAFRLTLMFGLGPALLAYAEAVTGRRIPTHHRRGLAVLTLASLALALLSRLLEGADPYPLQDRTSVLTALLLFSFAAGLYLWTILRLLGAHLTHLKTLFSNIENRTLSWLRWMVFLLAAAWLIDLIDSAASLMLSRPLLTDFSAALVEAAWVFPLTALLLRQQDVQPSSAAEALDPAAPKYDKSALNDARMGRIAEKLDRLMRIEKRHRNPGLSLRDVQALTGVSRAHLSQTLSLRVGKTFYDYVNQWRIEDACALLLRSSLSVTEISLEVGFQSRSTFNSAFLKVRGVSPTVYRRGNLDDRVQPLKEQP